MDFCKSVTETEPLFYRKLLNIPISTKLCKYENSSFKSLIFVNSAVWVTFIERDNANHFMRRI